MDSSYNKAQNKQSAGQKNQPNQQNQQNQQQNQQGNQRTATRERGDSMERPNRGQDREFDAEKYQGNESENERTNRPGQNRGTNLPDRQSPRITRPGETSISNPRRKEVSDPFTNEEEEPIQYPGDSRQQRNQR